MADFVVLGQGANAAQNYPDNNGVAAPSATCIFEVSGNSLGESVKLQELPQGHVAWKDIANSTFTAPGSAIVKTSRGTKIRMAISGVSATSAIYGTLNAFDGAA